LVKKGINLRLIKEIYSISKILFLIVLEVSFIMNIFVLDLSNFFDFIVIDVKLFTIESGLVKFCFSLGSLFRVLEANESI